MLCCGENRTTPFCPQCGRTLDVLNQLLEHVRFNAKAQRVRVEALINDEERHQEKSTEGKYVQSKYVQKRVGTTQKWEAWAEALEQLLNKSES